jgi:NAD(P)-dependent dehydrogenase (short-subunit alcohol dehydrogenase family)
MPSVLITGCSTGFGLDAAVAAAQRGWRVFATMRNVAKRDALDAATTAAGVGPLVEVLPLDVTDDESVAQCVKEVLARTGGTLDGVVNNAGVSLGGVFEDVPDEAIRGVFETNLFGVMRVTRAVLPAMRAQGHGRIVVVSSTAAFWGAPAMSAYHGSKWAVEGWAESLSHEVSLFGIDVVLVEPGAYKTAIWDSSPRVIPPDSPYARFAEPLQRFVDETMVPHARDPREVADVIVKALEVRRPRLRYAVGPDAKATRAVRTLLPHRAVRAGLRRVVGLKPTGS